MLLILRIFNDRTTCTLTFILAFCNCCSCESTQSEYCCLACCSSRFLSTITLWRDESCSLTVHVIRTRIRRCTYNGSPCYSSVGTETLSLFVAHSAAAPFPSRAFQMLGSHYHCIHCGCMTAPALLRYRSPFASWKW